MKVTTRKRGWPAKLVVLLLIWGASCQAWNLGHLQRGGLPNVAIPTLGGSQLWADVAWADDWRVQRNVWSRHFRLLDSANTRRAWGSESYCVSLLPPNKAEHLVVLLHGLGRTRNSLRVLEASLEAEGYQVASLSYPSTRASVDEHAKSVEQVLNTLEGVERVSFITHSLGGRVVLRLFERKGDWMGRTELGSVVQLAPPIQGSELATKFEGVPFFAAILGPSFLEVAEASTETPPLDCEVLVVAGVRAAKMGWNPLVHGDDDGVVSFAETCADYSHVHLAVNGLHTFLMNDDAVLDAVSQFLLFGLGGEQFVEPCGGR